MRVIVLGGDGFCGWPSSLYLSSKGHDVHIVDNLSRRNIDNELEAESLTPIAPMGTRLAAWEEVSDNKISFSNIDVAEDYEELRQLFLSYKPDAVIHFAEQRAAPYSMKSSKHKRYTVDNNIRATHNVTAAIVENQQDIHVVHLGTMGVYGYGTAGMKIPEGYLSIKVATDEGTLIDQEVLYPVNPGSVYHMTKTLDQLIFAYYVKNDQLRVTDLHQGIVWGTQTEQTKMDERLINRFDYDGDWGTVLNRFLIQAAIKYPLTVHGTGGQTRAFININDSMKCILIALENPPTKVGQVEIFNQMTETHKIRDLAKLIGEMSSTPVRLQQNPRLEATENELIVENQKFLDLGLKPTLLHDQLLDELLDIAKNYSDRIDPTKIQASTLWKSN